MITEHDLQEAIAECLGQKNPTANTCIRLAAFYAIKKELYPDDNDEPLRFTGYSYKAPENGGITAYSGDTEFAKLINGKPLQEVLALFDELMASLSVIEPRMYAAVLRKLRGEIYPTTFDHSNRGTM